MVIAEASVRLVKAWEPGGILLLLAACWKDKITQCKELDTKVLACKIRGSSNGQEQLTGFRWSRGAVREGGWWRYSPRY